MGISRRAALRGARGLAAALLLAAGPGARAWHDHGHRVAAHVAELRLSPAARQAMRDLGVRTLSGVASWADGQTRSRPETRPWHYVNIPIDAPAYVRDRDCPDGACAVEKIAELRAALADDRRPRRERRDALKFLVHLVADLHQPMHAGDRRDRGGNETHLLLAGQRVDLHTLYDGLPQHCLPPGSPAARARALVRGGAGGRRDRGGPVEWANESHALARAVYRDLGLDPGRRERRRIDTREVDALCGPVAERLLLAGERLAQALDEALGGR